MSETQLNNEAPEVSLESIQSDQSWTYEPQFQSTGYGDRTMEIRFEPPEKVEIPEASVQDYSDTLCFKLYKPKAGYLKEAKAIREYRKLLQKDYDAIFEIMNWVELPAQEHEKAKSQNYICCQIWLNSFASINLEEKDDQKERFIKSHYEEAIVAAEEAGMTLRHYLKPLEKITEACTLLEEMRKLINFRLCVPGVKNINTQSGEVIQKTILKGNGIKDFDKLTVYSRDLSKIQWSEFQSLSLKVQLEQLTKGLQQFNSKVRKIRLLLENPLANLKRANSNLISRGPTLIPHIKKMHGYLKKILSNVPGLSPEDEKILQELFIEINTHVLYIVQTGRNLVMKVWEIVLMTRLCYIYVKDHSNTVVSLAPYDVVLKRTFKKDVKHLLKSSSYDSEDFFRTKSPDVVRKVPIIVDGNLELALHYQGHRNVVKNSGTRSPSSVYVRRKSTAGAQLQLQMLENSANSQAVISNSLKDGRRASLSKKKSSRRYSAK